MIHPAMACNPCKHGICEYEGDCETCIAQDRVRELEADCAVHRRSRDEVWARAEKAEARVAELKDLIHWALGEWPVDTIAVLFPEKPDDWPRRPFYWRSALRAQFEAREREVE